MGEKRCCGGSLAAKVLAAWLLMGVSVAHAYGLGQYEQVVLTMGSWRIDDIRQMRHLLDHFEKEHPHIRIIFDPTSPPEYDAVLEAQLENATGPDLMYLRSFSVSRNLYEKGYIDAVDEVPGLREGFSPEMLHPWTGHDGRAYGVPFIAVSHGIYYNVDLFRRLNLPVPQSWEELLSHAGTMKKAGIIPLANNSGDPWTVGEVVFCSLAPNFIGGREGRWAYLNGERCFNDGHMISAFKALKDLSPFLPPDHALLKYPDSLQLFAQGKAAMYLGGSWDIPFLETAGAEFEWSVFAPPPPRGSTAHVLFHLDAGMGLNAASQHKAAAREFLAWLTRRQSGRLIGNVLPGFFSLHREVPKLDNGHANVFLSLSSSHPTDIRLVWEKLREGRPNGYELLLDAAVSVIQGRSTPEEAADFLQRGLASWYEPAQRCRPRGQEISAAR